MKHIGNLEITKDNEKDFSDLVEVTGNLYIYSSCELPKLTTVGGYLNIYSSCELPKLTTVGGYLNISSSCEFTANKLTTVGGYLYIYSSCELTANKLTTVGGNLSIHSSCELPKLTTVGGNLYIYSSCELPKLTTVGGNLNISSSCEFTANKLTTVGGYLSIHSSCELPKLTTVGGYLSISSKSKLDAPLAKYEQSEAKNIVTSVFEAQGYLLADGILQNIISKKKAGVLTVYKTKHIAKDDITFVVFDGANYSHGKTLGAAKADLKYKLSSRDTSEFKKWKVTDKKPVEDLIRAYRAITGACFEGTKMFCESQELKAKYSVKEIFELTDGKYGNQQFVEFFK